MHPLTDTGHGSELVVCGRPRACERHLACLFAKGERINYTEKVPISLSFSGGCQLKRCS